MNLADILVDPARLGLAVVDVAGRDLRGGVDRRLLPTLDVARLLATFRRPICATPIALFGLAVVGMLWSEASWAERVHGIGPAAKLLMLPLLFYHFERSGRGVCVFIAFLISCVAMMATSWAVVLDLVHSLKPPADAERGIFVKNYINQSQEFALCAVALAYPVMLLLRARKFLLAGLLLAIAAGFVVNMAFVVVSRTAMVTMPIMLAVFALLHLKRRSIFIVAGIIIVFAGVAWLSSPQLRKTADSFVDRLSGLQGAQRPDIDGDCGWNSGKNRYGFLPKRRWSGTAPVRPAGCSKKPP